MAADPIVAASGIVLALQSIVARNVDPLDPAVITVGSFQSGALATIIPGEARMNIGVRTCTKGTRELIRKRIETLVALQAKAFGCEAEFCTIRASAILPATTPRNTPIWCARWRSNWARIRRGWTCGGPSCFPKTLLSCRRSSCYFGLGNGKSRSCFTPATTSMTASGQRPGVLGQAGRALFESGLIGEPGADRTRDLLIKSQTLYH